MCPVPSLRLASDNFQKKNLTKFDDIPNPCASLHFWNELNFECFYVSRERDVIL